MLIANQLSDKAFNQSFTYSVATLLLSDTIMTKYIICSTSTYCMILLLMTVIMYPFSSLGQLTRTIRIVFTIRAIIVTVSFTKINVHACVFVCVCLCVCVYVCVWGGGHVQLIYFSVYCDHLQL